MITYERAFAYIVVASVISILITSYEGFASMRNEIVKHNCAHYDGQTGDFQWNK